MKAISAPLVSLALAIPLAGGLIQRAGLPPTSPITNNSAATTATIVAAANVFLATLSDAERSKATFAFNSSQRTGWSNLPTGFFQRNGLRFGDLTQRQKDAALALVAAALSREGYQKVTNIMNGDQVLRNRGSGTGKLQFGLNEYYIALLGSPSTASPWMIQFGGHHLAINITIAGANQVMTPSLPAAQPGSYTLNGQIIRPLGKENDKGFALINALTAAQQKQAILNYEVKDLVLGPREDGKVIQPEGIPGSELNASQQAMLLDLANEWVGILNDEGAAAKREEIKANLPRTYFAWSGVTKNGGVAYYRIQGPTVVIEYAPQQGDVDHIHTIYRDPTNDYGARFIKQ